MRHQGILSALAWAGLCAVTAAGCRNTSDPQRTPPSQSEARAHGLAREVSALRESIRALHLEMEQREELLISRLLPLEAAAKGSAPGPAPDSRQVEATPEDGDEPTLAYDSDPGLALEDLFESEPPDARWSYDTESALLDWLEENANEFPDTELASAECQQSLCRVELAHGFELEGGLTDLFNPGSPLDGAEFHVQTLKDAHGEFRTVVYFARAGEGLPPVE
jgi:hypothetical protein